MSDVTPDPPRDPEARERATDGRWYQRLGNALTTRENWYRDVWLFFITLFVLAAVGLSQNASNKAVDATTKVQEGRRIGSAITCGASNAIIKAGRNTILSSATVKPRELEINLVKLGLPRQKARAFAAKAAADAYAQTISNDIASVAGPAARAIVRKDGTLDCQALFEATNVDDAPGK